MSEPRFELRQLRYADALARTGNFGRAAEELGIAQSTLSRAIQGLEEKLGAPLFDRLPRVVIPTPLGELFIERAAPILASVRDLDRELAATLGLETGRLRVLVGPYVASVLLGPALGRFMERAPGVTVEVDEADTRRLMEILARGEADVAVAEASLFPDRSAFVVEPLRVRRGEYVCRPGHPLLRRSEVRLEDVLGYPLATTQIGSRAWTRLAAGTPWADRAEQLAESGSIVRCQSLTALADLVETSDAIGIFSRGIIRRRLAEGTLAILPFHGQRPTSDWGIIRRAGRTPSPAAQAFMAAVRVADEAVPVD